MRALWRADAGSRRRRGKWRSRSRGRSRGSLGNRSSDRTDGRSPVRCWSDGAADAWNWRDRRRTRSHFGTSFVCFFVLSGAPQAVFEPAQRPLFCPLDTPITGRERCGGPGGVPGASVSRDARPGPSLRTGDAYNYSRERAIPSAGPSSGVLDGRRPTPRGDPQSRFRAEPDRGRPHAGSARLAVAKLAHRRARFAASVRNVPHGRANCLAAWSPGTCSSYFRGE